VDSIKKGTDAHAHMHVQGRQESPHSSGALLPPRLDRNGHSFTSISMDCCSTIISITLTLGQEIGCVRKPSFGAIAVGSVPFTAVCFSVPLWDRVYPMVLGLPFNFFWLILWILITPLIMSIAYRLERGRSSGPSSDGKEGGAQ